MYLASCNVQFVAKLLKGAGFNILSVEEPDEMTDGEVLVHPLVWIQVCSDSSCIVWHVMGDGLSWYEYASTKDFGRICSNVKEAIAKANGAKSAPKKRLTLTAE